VGIPAFNEEKNIAAIITKLADVADSLIVCNDGSSDLTSDIAEKMGAFVINHEKNLGYGAAIRSIFLKAKELDGDILVTFDADGQHRVEDIEKYIVKFGDLDKIKFTDSANGNFIAYIEQLKLNGHSIEPAISHHPGFNLGAVYGDDVRVKEFYTSNKHEVFMCLDGQWKIYCEDQEIIIGPKDIFSVPVNMKRRFEKISSEFGFMYLIREKDH